MINCKFNKTGARILVNYFDKINDNLIVVPDIDYSIDFDEVLTNYLHVWESGPVLSCSVFCRVKREKEKVIITVNDSVYPYLSELVDKAAEML